MNPAGLKEVYDPKEILKGEIIVCVAREINPTRSLSKPNSSAGSCCRISARSSNSTAFAIVTKAARVDLSGSKPDQLAASLIKMLSKKLIGEKIICEGTKYGKIIILHGSAAHRTQRIEVYGSVNDLAIATINKPAKVCKYNEKRRSSKGPLI